MVSNAQQAAEEAAESVRALNHATIGSTTLEPPDVYATVAELVVLAQHLPQAYGQLAKIVDRCHETGMLGFDPDSRYADESTDAVDQLRVLFDAAIGGADVMRSALADAQRILSSAHTNLDSPAAR